MSLWRHTNLFLCNIPNLLNKSCNDVQLNSYYCVAHVGFHFQNIRMHWRVFLVPNYVGLRGLKFNMLRTRLTALINKCIFLLPLPYYMKMDFPSFTVYSDAKIQKQIVTDNIMNVRSTTKSVVWCLAFLFQ